MKVAIVGGGVAGLAIGWRLAQAQCDVTIFERGLAGRGATWAAAGMIAASFEMGEQETPLFELAHASRGAWPEFAREIESVSGTDLAYREPGALLVALAEEQEENLRRHANYGRWLSRDEVLSREPLLAPNLRGALHATDAALVDNRALGPALAKVFNNAGGKLRELCEVTSISVQSNFARGVVLARETVEADVVVLAAGAWCSGVMVSPPVRPVKGQMIALAPPPGVTLPNCPAWESEVYIVPRRDRLLVGATVEEVGSDTAVTAEAHDWLLGGAKRLVPSLGQWRVAEMWAGLRPATPDALPVLGRAGPGGLFVASGQFRNGILFAPAVADAVSRAVLGKPVPAFTEAFAASRF